MGAKGNRKRAPINLVQQLATPHNNVLIGGFRSYPNVELHLWYALDNDQTRYQWTTDITHEHQPAHIYGKSLNWGFIRYCLTHRDERYVLVGWANSNTKLLHLLFFLLRRPFCHWSDWPRDDANGKSIAGRLKRWLAYKLLRYSNAVVFGVGTPALDFFRGRGFPESRLVNLPIFVECSEDISAYHEMRAEIFSRYAIEEDDFFLSAGSRIVHEKGYDLLIQGIAALDDDVRQHVKLLIVGSGECLPELEEQVKSLNLAGRVIFEKWLAIDAFKAVIANSDVFIHPARFDSYGGTTLGMALGVPVIGSYGAGAAVDRIEHGKNGFLYDAEDVGTLASLIAQLYRQPEMRRQMADEARKTALSWPPERGVEILVEHAI